jgi:hypothetical protein
MVSCNFLQSPPAANKTFVNKKHSQLRLPDDAELEGTRISRNQLIAQNIEH